MKEGPKGRYFLLRPIEPKEIEWRVQSQTKDREKLIIVPYINNRCVMERFDQAFGWDNWSSEFKLIDGYFRIEKDKYGKEKTISYERGFICTIKIQTETGFVIKSDSAETTKIESLKGGVSDSMKRCAVQFGLGRDLYDYPKIMIETKDKYIPNWVKPRLEKMVESINKGEFKKDLVVLKEQ